MGRTLPTIYNELTASKEANSDLDNLLPNPDNWQTLYTYDNFRRLANTVTKSLNNSTVAIWRLIMYAVAYAIWLQEALYDTFETTVNSAVENREVGQIPWYVKQSKAFQFGDPLVWINDSYYGYETIDEEKQIITQAAATVTNGSILLKIAKGEIGSLSELDTDELLAFTLYMTGTDQPFTEDGIAPAGVEMEIISEAPDELRFSSQVFYNPQVLDNTGTLLSDGITKPVEIAITNYIQQIPFDSKFRISGLTDAIQAASGVVNVTINNCDAKTASQLWVDSVDVIAATGRQYIARAGYLKMGDDYGLDGYYDFPANLIPTIEYISE